jgi:hypothetical protein
MAARRSSWACQLALSLAASVGPISMRGLRLLLRLRAVEERVDVRLVDRRDDGDNRLKQTGVGGSDSDLALLRLTCGSTLTGIARCSEGGCRERSANEQAGCSSSGKLANQNGSSCQQLTRDRTRLAPTTQVFPWSQVRYDITTALIWAAIACTRIGQTRLARGIGHARREQ